MLSRRTKSAALLVAIVISGVACLRASGPAEPTFAERLPSASAWLAHLNRDLLPFWTMPAALGVPIGNFPTFRCNDGARFDRAKPCPELALADPWIREELDRDYVRMKSRQVYAYGVAYHLTGDEKMLEL